MKGWKTVLFNALAGIWPVLQTLGADLGFEGKLAAGYAVFVVIGNGILRIYTTTPIGKKE